MATNPPAGWYTDPHGSNGVRYWDGATWTEHTNSTDAAPGTDAMPVASGPAATTEQINVKSSDGTAPDSAK